MPKNKFPYNFEALTWDSNHERNKEYTYCYCGEDINDDQPFIRCEKCKQWFHRDCIECMIKPLLYGDTFGTFHCSVCNQGSESFERKGLSWIAIVHLVIYNLIKKAQVEDSKKTVKDRRDHYYFRWKEDVCAMIDAYWDYLLPDKTRSATWNNTIASVLSTHSALFLSGFEKFHQSAWWTLHKVEPPTIEKKAKATTKLKPNLKKPLKRSKTADSGDDTKERLKRMKMEKKNELAPPEPDLLDLSSLSSLSSADEHLASDDNADLQSIIRTKKENGKRKQQEKQINVGVATAAPTTPEVVPPSPRATIIPQAATRETSREPSIKQETPPPEKTHALKQESIPIPSSNTLKAQTALTNIQHLSPQDEWSLLQRLEHSSKSLPYSAYRFKRKLAVRRLKRNLGFKLFDFDAHIMQYLRNSKNEPISKSTTIQPASNQQQQERQEDEQRQQAKLEKITFTPYASSFASRVLGSIRQRDTMTREEPWLSSWNGRKLRPFIRRDYTSKPNRMLMMGQIRACQGKPVKKGDQVEDVVLGESIDYVYFQKEHLGQVNDLLKRSFWEGIDVSESLLFPEFSIVALYKRHVIGCAFMTPEAYITYFAVDAGWGSVGIGQFMLYHLFQTAISKDITLHVSANNNAMILYQKFGFKPEEFIVNFYDKYLPADSVYSKNAFFLRLRR